MQFQHIDRSDPEKAYAAVKNVSGGTLSAGAAVFYDVAAATADGISVSNAGTTRKWAFAGILPAALSNSSYGRAQVYGICSAYMVLNATGVSAVAGQQLDAVNSATYLKDYTASDYYAFTAVSSAALSITLGNPWNFVTLMDTVVSSNGYSAAHSFQVFVRAI